MFHPKPIRRVLCARNSIQLAKWVYYLVQQPYEERSRLMKTLEIGWIQIGKEIVNALDIGVISDGKTDCSGIINAFLSSKENANKTLFIPKGKYYFKDTINVDENFCGIYIEQNSIIHSDGNPSFNCVGVMSEQDIKENLVAFYALHTDDWGQKDKNLEDRTRRILEKMYYEDEKSVDRLISSLLYEYFLSKEMINKGYGIEDAKSFLD